jgi:hypothetical protein|tara:strand:+ start:1059 stop:1463 length:405 start_codon:yes stop_codon:yes gene_type:complete
MAYIQKNNPFPVTSCGRRRSFMNNNVRRQVNSPGKDRTEESPFQKADPRRTIGKGKNFNKVSKNKSAEGGAAGGGMTEKGVKEYKRNNPGSKLQTAVTEKNPSKKNASRRKSFCARSRSWKSERGLAARRRWRC